MSSSQIEVMLIAMVIAMASSLVGVFLVLKKMAMMSDAITHTVLLGIVLVFFVVQDLSSPWLMAGAVVMGLITVYLIEMIASTRLLSEEASIGVVFPFIFSVAIILITRYAGTIHLDTDAVLLGELAFAPLDRWVIFGWSVPSALVIGLLILLINVFFVSIFFKELKITTFDAILAATLGFSPVLMNYLLMSVVSITAVGAFNAVGSILVIAFMIGPPISAFLLTHDLKRLIGLSLLFSLVNVVVGYQIARFYDVSIAGSMALMTGITFLITFLFSPHEGYITRRLRKRSQRRDFLSVLILFHLQNHSGVEESKEITIASIYERFNRSEKKIDQTLDRLVQQKYIEIKHDELILTDSGRAVAVQNEQLIFDR